MQDIKQTDRRDFLQRSVLGAAGAGLAIASTTRATLGDDAEEKQASAFDVDGGVTKKVDVLVVGGGAAGLVAAIQSARAGAKTILIEAGSQLGGTTTTGGVAFPGLFHAWGKQVIRGIGWELIEETVEMNGDVLQDFSKPLGRSHVPHHISVNRYLYAILAEEKCVESGVQLRYYETPVKAALDGATWVVDAVGKGTHATIYSNQLIDCTGNALIAQMAGYDVLRSRQCQPGSMMFKLAGYDPKTLDLKLIQREYQKALQEGTFKREEYFGEIHRRLLGTGHYTNERTTFTNHIHGADSTTSETHTAANIQGRNTLLRMLRFLRTLPGLEDITIHSMCPETSIRETYRIDGEHEITVDEYVSGKLFEDAVCHSFYPIDLHDKAGVKPKQLSSGVVPTVPLRALAPKRSRNFLVAGRCASSDQLANSALRVQASCMAMGQAAGAVAALAARGNTTPLHVPLEDIRTMLRQHGAIVPEV
jgi:glycine/D-amino acid oxidase-like deaminating enzyme